MLAGFGVQRRVRLGPDSRKHYLGWELEEQRGNDRRSLKAHEMPVHRAVSVVITNACAHTRMHPKHIHLPTGPMHRSLHTPHARLLSCTPV